MFNAVFCKEESIIRTRIREYKLRAHFIFAIVFWYRVSLLGCYSLLGYCTIYWCIVSFNTTNKAFLWYDNDQLVRWCLVLIESVLFSCNVLFKGLVMHPFLSATSLSHSWYLGDEKGGLLWWSILLTSVIAMTFKIGHRWGDVLLE